MIASRTSGGLRARGVPGVLALAVLALPLQAQTARPDPQEEGRRLRDAAARESRGDVAGAERVLVDVLERSPASSAALFALERVLRAQERVREVLPLADRFLAVEPSSAGVRYLKLRVLVEVDSLETLEADAAAWFDADPRSPDPYREVARIYERAYGPERALELLARARAELGDPGALAVEMGDILARSGQAEAAVVEWSRAIAEGGGELTLVLRRIAELPGGGGEVTPLLLAAVAPDPTSRVPRTAAVLVALETGLVDEALALARRAAEGLPEQARRSFLTELTRRGEEMHAFAITLWAYETLRDGARDPQEVRTFNQRIASVALAAGDSARAMDAQERLVRSLGEGSPERLRAMMELIRLEAARAAPERLTALLEDFRAEFPESPELDDLASTVAAGLQAQGHSREARSVLEGVSGPRSSLERTYLLFDQGQIQEGKAALAEALGGLAPAHATDAIQLLTLLGRLSPRSQEALARAAVLEHAGHGVAAADQLVEGVGRLPEDDRPALLAHAARLLDAAEQPERGARLRRRLLEDHPQALEAPGAMLALARHQARSPAGLPEAVALLEALILKSPSSPVVPDARRELQRLRARVPGGPR